METIDALHARAIKLARETGWIKGMGHAAKIMRDAGMPEHAFTILVASINADTATLANGEEHVTDR